MYTAAVLAFLPFALGAILLKMAFTKDLRLGIKQTPATSLEKKKLVANSVVMFSLTVVANLWFVTNEAADHDHKHEHTHEHKQEKVTETT